MIDSADENKKLDQYGVWVKTPEESVTQSEDSVQDSAQDDALPDFSFLDETPVTSADDMFADDSSLSEPAADIAEESVEEPVMNEEPAAEENLELDDFIAGTSDDSPSKEVDPAESVPDIPDGDVDLDSFFDDSPAPEATDSHEDGEISLDDFMGGDSSSGDSGDVSLDSFLDPSEFGLETETKEEEVTYDQPMSIDLSFDDSVQTETEEDDADSSGSAGETAGEDYDDLFDNIVDEGPKEEVPVTHSTESSIDMNSEEVDLNEFGVGDIDTGFVKGPDANKPKANATVDYDIAVDTDDGGYAEDTVSDTETSADDEESVEIEVEESAAPVTSGANDTDFGAPDDSFDVDSILDTVDMGSAEKADTTEEPALASDSIPDTFEEEAASLTQDTFSDAVETADTTETSVEEETAGTEKTLDDFIVNEPTITEGELSVPSPALEDNFELPQSQSPDNDEDLFGDSETEQTSEYNIPEFLPDENAVQGEQTDSEPEVEFEEPAAETAAPVTRTAPATEAVDNTDILKSIASELASLKSEIAGLKTEFADLRAGNTNSVTATPALDNPAPAKTGFFGDEDDGDDSITLSMEELNNVAQDATEKSTGFFGDEDDGDDSITLSMEELNNVAQDAAPQATGFFGDEDDGDDSIALSGDEMNNIMNSAEFTQEEMPQNEVAVAEDDVSENNGLSMNFAEEKLEEPVFDEDLMSSGSADEQDEEIEGLPSEISVHKSDDDIFVESSSSDMLQDDATGASGEKVEDIPEESDEIEEEEIPDVAQVEYTPAAEGYEAPIDLFENDEVEPMTEKTFEYLEDDAAPAESEIEDEDEESEGAINDEPAEGVFNQWNGEEEAAEESVAETVAAPVVAEVSRSTESAPVVKTESTQGIPETMKQEIKSVLSYMDQLLESLPEEKITEFAKSEQFETYKKLFTELGLA